MATWGWSLYLRTRVLALLVYRRDISTARAKVWLRWSTSCMGERD